MKEKFNVNGKTLTAKEYNVLNALNAFDNFVDASQVTVDGLSLHAVRSTMARLSKTHGLLNEKVDLINEKPYKTYTVKDGIEIPANDAE